MRVHHRQTQSCSHSRVHDVAPGDEQLSAQVGARGYGQEDMVLGHGRRPVPWALPSPKRLLALTCRADDGTVVVHTRGVGVPAGPGGCRGLASCRVTLDVELPRGQGEASDQQQQGGAKASPGPGQPANLIPAEKGVLRQAWDQGTTKNSEGA